MKVECGTQVKRVLSSFSFNSYFLPSSFSSLSHPLPPPSPPRRCGETFVSLRGHKLESSPQRLDLPKTRKIPGFGRAKRFLAKRVCIAFTTNDPALPPLRCKQMRTHQALQCNKKTFFSRNQIFKVWLQHCWPSISVLYHY